MNRWERLVAQLRPRRNADQPVPFQVLNLSRNTVLATHLTVADSSRAREKGLLGRNSLPVGEGLWIVPCQAIHMFFMRFAIDLIYIDRKKRVRKVRSNVAPWRISVCLSAHSVLELPAGVVRDTGTQRGDLLQISPAPLSNSPSTPEAQPASDT
jgi:uncharacterized protein